MSTLSAKLKDDIDDNGGSNGDDDDDCDDDNEYDDHNGDHDDHDDHDDGERLVPVVARRKTFTTGCGGSRPAGKRSLPKKKATL